MTVADSADPCRRSAVAEFVSDCTTPSEKPEHGTKSATRNQLTHTIAKLLQRLGETGRSGEVRGQDV